ncbi:colicin transporter [Rhizorhapis sp. SPR117]|uniref:colicin transporter n=1 Tax=Rhizorhapis sp. SPR117 TaxID=2912611 RepID=UPI001F1B39C2|nr:colicin transporter [Rhizorhapis sp. SPR117]
MIAVKRLQSIFWVLLVALGAIAVYLVSLRVASERTELARVEAQILSTKRDMRYLETEFGARASLRQLERWNNENFRFSTPTVAQYLNGEKALASLDGIAPGHPGYVAAPVMTAMVETDDDLPAAVAKPAVAPAAAQVHEPAAVARPSEEKAEPGIVRTASARVAPEPRRVERMAMLEQTLLDDHTLGDIARLAARENGRMMRR